jgi:adenylosuccinate lyase
MAILPIDAKRYGSEEIRAIFEEKERLKRLLLVEAEVARVQAKLNLIPEDAAEEIARKALSGKITVDAWRQKEKEVGHEVGALVELLVQLCSKEAKPFVHYGLTSNDVLDTATSLQIRDALSIIEERVRTLVGLLSELALKYENLPAAGRTHGQYASIIPFGLRFAVWAEEFDMHIKRLEEIRPRVLLCKVLGAVGTGSLMGAKALDVQREVAARLGLYPVLAATQVVARERLAELVSFLALLSSTMERVAVTLRLLQRAEVEEVEEPFGKAQIGSSAIPTKRNPIGLEKVTSHARLVRALSITALENVALWEERDLTNSANERTVIPTSLIITEDALLTLERVIRNLRVFKEKVFENVRKGEWSLFAEALLNSLLKRGMSRNKAYRLIQELSWKAKQAGGYLRLYERDAKLKHYFSKEELVKLLDPYTQLEAGKEVLQQIIKGLRSNVTRDAPSGHLSS